MSFINKYSTVLIAAFLLTTINTHGQDKYKSSRTKELKTAQSTLAEARQYLEQEDPLETINLLSGFLKARFQDLDPSSESEIFYLIGKANFQLTQYDLAIQNYRKALGQQNKNRSKIRWSRNPEIYKEMGRAYYAKNDWASAIDWYQQYLSRIDPKLVSQQVEGQILLGRAQLAQGNTKAALDIGQKAQAGATSLQSDSILSEATFFVGEVFEQQNNFDEGLSYLQQSNELAISANSVELSKESSAAIGRVLRAKDDPQAELDFKQQELQKSIEQNDLGWQNKLNLDIAEIYMNIDKSDQAIPYLKQSVELSEQLGTLQQNIEARKSLSSVYAAQGDYSLALSSYRAYVSLVDQLYENKQKEIELSSQLQQDLFEKQSTIGLLQKDRELNESQILLLEKDKELKDSSIARQRLMIYGLLLLMMVVVLAAYLLYKSMLKKRRAHQLLALKSLRSQMNPHFIFNALNSVNGFISQNDSKQANKYLSDFSKLMRTVMENSQKDFVPLEEEIETLNLYLKLEHHRFHDKFEYELNIPETLDVDQYRIPPMLIQPYIENAIWHGLRYKDGPGFLKVSIENGSPFLILTVEDNGIGRSKSQELKTRNQKSQTSMGMRNIKDRIQLLNETYQCNITYSVEDQDKALATGTRVVVKIPRNLVEEIL